MTAEENWNTVFSQNPERVNWILECIKTDVVPQIDSFRPMRILNLGCGYGEGSFRLAEQFPQAQVFGLDISEASIARGRRELQVRQLHRVSFDCGDYSKTRFPNEHFDLIVADSVLHFIPDAEREIIPKIAGELAPGGHLVFSIPDKCLFNRLLWIARSILRNCRSSLTDQLVLAIAKVAHRKSASDAFLRERINYMYTIPSIWFSKRLRFSLCADQGLVNVRERRYPHSSLGQFRHRLCILSKPACAGLAALKDVG
jgi:2-polyprenyl-3-methyl-5-hydroxy-6-metoxy-1,4-benzoquinol methylase